MVGIPDGLGAFNSDHRRFTLLMNHELTAPVGIPRAHGSKGAFVSRWTIDRRTLVVLKGEDFTQSPQDVHLWDPAAQTYTAGTTVWERHCSADLARPGAFFHQGKGTTERLYLNGEEVSQGRAWARIATGPNTGEAWQLPRFGKMSYENAVASPYPQSKTVVMLTDDGALSTAGTASAFPSEVFVYVEHPEQGGTIEILLKGNEGQGMLDNVTIDRLGRIVMDEDPGNAARVSKIWVYQIATGEFFEVAHHNPAFFDSSIPNNPAFITQDEESSGIIDAAHILGPGWFLLDVQ